MLVQAQAQRQRESLLGHKERVTYVHWLPEFPEQETRLLVSGSSDGSVALWAVHSNGSQELVQMRAPGSGHTSTINGITSLLDHSRLFVDVVSVAGDSTCCCWRVNSSGGFELVETFTTTVMQRSAALCPIPELPNWCDAASAHGMHLFSAPTGTHPCHPACMSLQFPIELVSSSSTPAQAESPTWARSKHCVHRP